MTPTVERSLSTQDTRAPSAQRIIAARPARPRASRPESEPAGRTLWPCLRVTLPDQVNPETTECPRQHTGITLCGMIGMQVSCRFQITGSQKLSPDDSRSSPSAKGQPTPTSRSCLPYPPAHTSPMSRRLEQRIKTCQYLQCRSAQMTNLSDSEAGDFNFRSGYYSPSLSELGCIERQAEVVGRATEVEMLSTPTATRYSSGRTRWHRSVYNKRSTIRKVTLADRHVLLHLRSEGPRAIAGESLLHREGHRRAGMGSCRSRRRDAQGKADPGDSCGRA